MSKETGEEKTVPDKKPHKRTICWGLLPVHFPDLSRSFPPVVLYLHQLWAQEKDFESSIGIMNPLVFEPDQDFLVWRKKVASWVDLIATAASKGSEKLYKTVFCTLRRQLYNRWLRQAQQRLVDEAQEQGKIDYKQENQVKAVQQIVDLIAKDPPIAIVTRLIDSFNKVTSCKRKGNEDLNRFVARFRGLAAEHLMCAGTNNHSQIREVLAITLLNNASLLEASLTNAKLRLIGMAEDRAKHDNEGEKMISIKVTDSKRLLNRVHALRKSLQDLDADSNGRNKALIQEITKKYNKVALGVMPLLHEVDRKKEVADVTKAIASSGPRCILSLDDAVTVLRSLAQTSSKPEQTVTKAQMDFVVDQKVRSYFSNQRGNFQSMNNDKDRKGRKPKRKSDNETPASNKTDKHERKSKRFRIADLVGDACMDCGSKHHSRGDSDCKRPSFATLKLQEAKSGQKTEESDGDSPSNEGGYFHPGSRHTKGKGAS